MGLRVLLAEDDDASRRFLGDALEAFGCVVQRTADGDAALAAARALRFDLLLVDRRLPRRDAFAIVRALRDDPSAASHAARAIATSAEWSASLRHEAAAAGFALTLPKPMTLAALRAAIETDCHVVRDDAAARLAAGRAANARALRELFRAELDRWQRDVACASAHGDASLPGWSERLHRLCASAGFCGAPALAAASRALLQDLRQGNASCAALERFRTALAAAARDFAQA